MKYEAKYSLENKQIDPKDFMDYLLKLKGVKNTEKFLHPTREDLIDPLLLDNIMTAAHCVLKHVENCSNIFIQVDSDTDGYCSAAIMYLYLKKLNPALSIEWRIHEGKQHGVIVEEVPEYTNLVIIPDAGSNQYEEHKLLREKGMDIIVLDHHIAEKDSEDAMVVNNQLSDNFEDKDLSGAGIVYKFIEVLDNLTGNTYHNLFIDLTAVAIVGDMMQLINPEIRYIVSNGLRDISNFGLQTFIDKQAFSMQGRVTPTTVAFYVVPLINALIRIGDQASKETLFRAFIRGNETTPSSKRGAKIGDLEVIAEQAVRLCTNAKNRQQKLRDNAFLQLDMKIQKMGYDMHRVIFVPVEEDESFDTTLTGLIAMQLLTKYRKPVIVARLNSDGYYRGSARGSSTCGIKDLRKFFEDSEFFEYATGHANAHGISIHKNRVENFLKWADEQLADIEFNDKMYEVDFILNAEDSSIKPLIMNVGQLQDVWGQGIEEPLIVIENIELTTKELDVIGADKSTSKFNSSGVTFIKFKDTDFIQQITCADRVNMTVIGRAQLNDFGGNITPQFVISDYMITEDTYEF